MTPVVPPPVPSYVPVLPPEPLLEFLRGGSRFLIAGHKEPDGDCVGSQLALSHFLRRLGKDAAVCSAGPFKRTEILPYEGMFLSQIGEEEKRGRRLIVVDCSALERTGDLEKPLGGMPLVVIDHHDCSPAEVNAADFRDPRAPATCAMILLLIEAMGFELDSEEATLLFLGLCTDTGFFRHLGAGSEAAFLQAARLARAGANPKAAFQAINGGKTLDSRLLLGLLLTRAEPFFDGRLLMSYEEYADTQRFGLESRDSDTLYQLLLSVEGVEAIAVVRQETAGNCTAGLRSKDRVDVARVAAALGGGGHKNAAGLSTPGSISSVRQRLLAAFTPAFR